jgi:hypothetical protein
MLFGLSLMQTGFAAPEGIIRRWNISDLTIEDGGSQMVTCEESELERNELFVIPPCVPGLTFAAAIRSDYSKLSLTIPSLTRWMEASFSVTAVGSCTFT